MSNIIEYCSAFASRHRSNNADIYFPSPWLLFLPLVQYRYILRRIAPRCEGICLGSVKRHQLYGDNWVHAKFRMGPISFFTKFLFKCGKLDYNWSDKNVCKSTLKISCKILRISVVKIPKLSYFDSRLLNLLRNVFEWWI